MKRSFSTPRLLKQTSSFNKIRLYAPRKDSCGRSPMPVWVAKLFLISIVLVSCSSSRRPITLQVLTFNYNVIENANVSDLVNGVRSGTSTIAAFLGPDPCNFTADFSSVNHPTASANGTPGQMGFSVSLTAVNPSNITTTNPSSCIAIREIQITIGGPSQALALRAQSAVTEGEIVLADGRSFNMGQFFQGRVQTFEAATRRTSGDFRFITSLSGNSSTVLIAEGSYALTP